MSTLQNLVGLIIKKTEKKHDYIQIGFSNDTTLTIFNSYTYDSGSILGIEGKAVKSVAESDSSVEITFECSESLSIGLGNDDFNGPEAMVLRQDGKPSVVWN